MTPFSLSGWLAGFSALLFGIFVYFKSTNRRLGTIWLFFSLAVAAWGFGAAWIGATKTYADGLLAWRVAYGLGVIWIAPLFSQFVNEFLEEKRRYSEFFHYGIAAFFWCLLPTPLLFKNVRWVFDSFYFATGGKLFGLFFLWWIGLVLYSHVRLWRAQAQVSGIKREQIKYFFLATCIGYTGGSIGFITNFEIDWYPWGNFSVFLYPLIMAYAITRNQWLDIRIVLKKTLAYSIIAALITGIDLLIVSLIAAMSRSWMEGTLSAAIATSFFAALTFRPLLRWTQRRIDVWFDLPDPERERRIQEVKEQLSSQMAHEVKLPLSNITLPAELTLLELEEAVSKGLSVGPLVPKIQKRMKWIMGQVLLADQRLEALQDAVDADAPRASISLWPVLEQSLKALSELVDRHRIDIIKEDAENLPEVFGNARQLEIVFSNLIKNAIEAMADLPEEKRRALTITVVTPTKVGVQSNELDPGFRRDDVTIVISDTGPGIPLELREKIFEPRFTTKTKGMGIGLSLAKEIVGAHHGSLTVSNRAHGASFAIRLPVSDDSENAHGY